MSVLLKLPKLQRNRSLMTIGRNLPHYGPLLIPVILERLPDSIKLIITQKLEKNNWHVTDFINCIKKEVGPCENCDFIKDKNNYKHSRNTNHSLLIVQKYPRKKMCILWKIALR